MDNFKELYNKIPDKYKLQNKKVKRFITKYNFFDYFLKDRKKIIEWNKKNKLLKFTNLFFTIKLSDDFKQKMDELFLNNVLPATKYIDEIIKNGWQWRVISINQYNHIVLFADFCNKMSSMEKKKSITHKDFFLVEEAFLKITANDRSSDTLIKSLGKILLFEKKIILRNPSDIEIKDILKKLEYFFLQNYFYPSFYEIILAYNMYYYKRYFEWSNLLNMNLEDVIPSSFYNCSPDIFKEITLYIKELSNDIKNLETEKKQIAWQKDLSEIKKIDGPEIIKKFYEKLGYDWNKDTEDFFLLLISIIEGILSYLNQIIYDDFQMMTNDEKIITINIVKNNLLIENIYKKIKEEYELVKTKHLAVVHYKILLKEYLKKDYPEVLFKKDEYLYMYEKIMKILSYIRQIAIIFNSFFDPGNKEYVELFNYMIVNPFQWRGNALFTVFKYFTELFLQICGYFKENELILDIKRLKIIENDLAIKKEKLKNIYGEDDYVKEVINNFSF